MFVKAITNTAILRQYPPFIYTVISRRNKSEWVSEEREREREREREGKRVNISTHLGMYAFGIIMRLRRAEIYL